jgi:hypothetical protein
MFACIGSRLFAAASLSAFLISTSCVKHVSTLPPGPVTISGVVNDATGLPLSNNPIRLFRERKYLKTSTDASGHYAFPNLAGASYRLLPRMQHCFYIPRDADLDHVTASITEDFGGFGPGCGGEPKVNMGALSGPLAISGHIRDASGQPIVFARVDLHGGARGIRFTGLTGTYSFQVEKGNYELKVSGACMFTPARVDIDDLKANAVHDVAASPGCVAITATQSNVNPTGSQITLRQGGTDLGTTYVRAEQRSSPADAATRLLQIVAEQPAAARNLTIAGNPAIERQTLVNLPGPGAENEGPQGTPAGPFLALTTAIVVGKEVVRFESQLPANADAATIALFFETGRNFTPVNIADLHGPPLAPVPVAKNPLPPPPALSGSTASGVIAPGVFGELELAASDTANVVVYGTQNGPFFSSDGGTTVKAATYNKVAAPPSAGFISLGDPTVAIGAPNAAVQQTIYFAQLEQITAKPPGGNNPVAAIGLYSSTDNGTTFNSTSFPINCSSKTAGCVVPDQEHLTADRITRAVTPTGTADQLYLVWRNYTLQGTNAHTIAVACSRDGGLTWPVVDTSTLTTSGGDFPKAAVGPDGSLMVAFGAFTSSTAYTLNVQKWSSCASGLNPGALAQVVKTVTDVTDMPGTDRKVSGNYALAFDDSDGSAQTIFAAYSNEPSAGNDDVHVVESRDGGATWVRDSIVNTTGNGRRYFPWICSSAGTKFVTWYDRRNSTAAKPDLTAYYRSSVSDNGSANTVGIGTELNVSGVDDPQCAAGFVSGVSGAVEEAGCKNLPAGVVQGGTCQLAVCPTGVAPPCGTGNACDFRASNPCPTTGESCVVGGGQPMYGDYNGAACAQGALFMAWASSTPPKGVACFVNGLPAASASSCCSGNLSAGFCAPTAAGCVGNGASCAGGGTCCSASINGRCQAGVCLPAVSMYTGSSCIGPACAGLPVTLTYHQTGACNGFPGTPGAGPKAAYVAFGIERIDNSFGTTTFNFDPANLFVQQAGADFFDSGLAIYTKLFGPFAITPQTLTAGDDRSFAPVAQGATLVSTANIDGSTEANQTSYLLQYKRQPADPPILFVKSNVLTTSFPNTQDCTTIVLK